MAEEKRTILKVEGLTKRFGGVLALDNVQFDLMYGEVHALVGENGAGKSTLSKVIGGVHKRDTGTIIFEGNEVDFNRPSEAQDAGISIIYQELSMMPSLNIIENIFIGKMQTHLGIIDWKKLEERTTEVLQVVGLDVDPHTVVEDLSVSQRQMVEIAKALASNAKLIIMDEPNSSLSESETERLFDVIKSLQEKQIAIIYVSHKIEEVLRISDRITVLRDGKYVGTIDAADATKEKIINMMVGRELDRTTIIISPKSDKKIMEVHNLCGERFHNINFDLREGEILGFAGLMGAGRSELANAIFGEEPYESGEILLDGKKVKFSSTADAIKHGIGMVQEDRKVLSLFMDLSIKHNILMAELPDLANSLGLLSERKEKAIAEEFVKKLDIRLSSIENPVSSLSGGNQQKTVLARWLATNPKILILDEPTHGVDVGAKAEIYELIRNLAKASVSIILISSELVELMTMAYRIVVMHEGRITGILPHDEATEDKLMAYATALIDDFAPEKMVEA